MELISKAKISNIFPWYDRPQDVIAEIAAVGIDPETSSADQEREARERIFSRSAKEYLAVLQSVGDDFPSDKSILRAIPAMGLQFPDPNDATPNDPAYLLRRNITLKLFENRVWPSSKGLDALEEALDDQLDVRDWIMLVAYCMGWTEASVVGGGQVLLKANLRINGRFV
jgi:hypothetical protein